MKNIKNIIPYSLVSLNLGEIDLSTFNALVDFYQSEEFLEKSPLKYLRLELNRIRVKAEETRLLKEQVEQLSPLKSQVEEMISMKSQFSELNDLRKKVKELEQLRAEVEKINAEKNKNIGDKRKKS